MAKVFFSYSHDDEEYRDQLEKHLAALKRQGLIESWHDRRISAGAEIDDAIDKNLEEADVILLLVSASFIASEYCYGVELQRGLERHRAGEVTVIPVIVRPCDWHKLPFGTLKAVPRDGKPITTWPNFDEAYADITREVRAVVEAKPQQKSSAAARDQGHQPRKPAFEPAPSKARSSNLRLRKEFTEADKDDFLHKAFDFIAEFFEASLRELQGRNPGIECRYRRVDSNSFTATIYRGGKRRAECAINLGGGFRRGGITYSADASSRGTSYNEELTVEHDDQTLYLKPLLAMAFHGAHEAKLTMEQAAEYYWEKLIESLQ
jgi:hypothetical protein